jgi:lipopolysaccharide/colanic/teichoic acid biosynthesis glycosyltransferase
MTAIFASLQRALAIPSAARKNRTPEGQAFLRAQPELYDSTSFHHQLSLERKRTERSGRPFMLVVLNLAPLLQVSANELQPLKQLCQALAHCCRDTDSKGWYSAHTQLGILYTEIGEQGDSTILDKLNCQLHQTMDPQYADLIEIRSLRFPNDTKENAPSDSIELNFYQPPLKSFSSTASQFCKRALDIVGSIVALLLFSPLLILIPIIIKFSSPGPILFRQQRLGYGGRPFTFYKYRSMYVNNDESIHKQYMKDFIAGEDVRQKGQYKLADDPRITPIGRLLRKTSLDELPQLFNVLKGEMSLVGPRPAIPYEVQLYRLWHRRRLLQAKPGITGIWQVKARSQSDFDTMVRLDIDYIHQQSFWLDVKLIVLTPLSMLTARGAL